MKAKDAMSADIASVTPDATVCEIAELLLSSRISVVPVIDGRGDLIGIIDEADLIRRSELGMTEQPQSWWLRPLPDNAAYEQTYLRCHATRVRDVMRCDVITVMEDDSLSEVVARLAQHQIARAPVLRDGRMVGIISHADVIRALASARPAIASDRPSDDGMTRTMVLEELASQTYAAVSPVTVSVTDGVVTLWGTYRSAEDNRAVRVAVGNVPGVRSIRDYRVPLSTLAG